MQKTNYDRALCAVLETTAAIDAARAKFKAEAMLEVVAHMRCIRAVYNDMEAAGCYNAHELAALWTKILAERR